LAVASQIFEVYSSFELHAPGYVDGIACLVGALDDAEPLAAELQHLRHEGKVLEPPPSVESSQYFFLAPNLDPVACPQTHDMTLKLP
jgi:hypothetical protein